MAIEVLPPTGVTLLAASDLSPTSEMKGGACEIVEVLGSRERDPNQVVGKQELNV